MQKTMIKRQKLKLKREKMKVGESIAPKGIHHTVSFAESFNDSWDHIQNELRRTYQYVHLQ